MNRENLFRAKGKNSFGQYIWYYGSYYSYRDINYCFDNELSEEERKNNIKDVIIYVSTGDWNMKNHLEVAEIDHKTLGMFVGRDKNNKPIYTGDIVKTYYENGDEFIEEIVYKNNQFLAKMMFEDIEMFSPLPKTVCIDPERVKMVSLEVIGNKFDNKELLEDK